MTMRRYDLLWIMVLAFLVTMLLWMMSLMTGCSGGQEAALDSWSGSYTIQSNDDDLAPDVHSIDAELVFGDAIIGVDGDLVDGEGGIICIEAQLFGSIQVCLECPADQPCEPIIRAPPEEDLSEVEPPADGSS